MLHRGSTTVSFAGWSQEEALLSLWKHARIVQDGHTEPTLKYIQKLLANPVHHIDYLNGRSIKIGNIKEDWPMLQYELYNRDNGDNKMQSVANRDGGCNTSILKNNDTQRMFEGMASSKDIGAEAQKLYNDLF